MRLLANNYRRTRVAKLSTSNQKVRDLVMMVLVAAIIGTNVAWYTHAQNSDRIDSAAWQQLQVDIGQLRACYETNIRPCPVTPTP